MRYKGKRVRVKLYKLFSDELIKVIEGKCIYCHQAQSIKDTTWFTIKDDKGEEHEIGGGEDHFSINIVTLQKRSKQ